MRRFITFELIYYLSDRDLCKVFDEVDKTTVLHAFCNVDEKILTRIKRVFTDSGKERFEKDIKSNAEISVELQHEARKRIAMIADQLFSEGELEDWLLLSS